ncbi:MAG: MFS transporter [Solirubrobacterales bacterium]
MPQAPLADRTRALVPVLVAMTLVVSAISSLGAPLLPAVASALGVSISAAQWSLTSALLAGAVAAPILGRLGDGPWRREAILGALAIVIAGGVVAGLARALPLLIAGRAMQGIGLGLAPIAMAAARDHLPPGRSPGVIGLLSVSAAAGVGAGYPISGLIASELDVFAAFLFGSVISAAAFVLAFLFVPSSRASSHMPVDVPGAVVGSAGVIALLLGIGQGEEWGWGSTPTLVAFGLALILLAAWVRLQLRTRVPLVELRLLSHRAVLGGDGAALLIAVALYMFLTIVTGFVQAPPENGFGFGGSTLTAGLVLVPFSVLSLLASRLMWQLTPLIGTRAVVVVGTAVIGAGGVFFALGHTALWQAFATMGVLGVGFGFTFAAIPGLISRAVPAEEAGSAMGFYQVVRSIGFSVGSALVASVLAAHEIGRSGFADQQGYVLAAWIGTGACVLAALWAGLLTPAARAEPGPPDPYVRDDAELACAGLIDAGDVRGSEVRP